MTPRLAVSLLLAAALALGPGCSKGKETEAAPSWKDSPQGRDLDRMCHAEARSGASEQEEAMRSLTVARWLGENLESAQARDLLAELSRAAPADKGKILRERAAAVGIEQCPTADLWK